MYSWGNLLQHQATGSQISFDGNKFQIYITVVKHFKVIQAVSKLMSKLILT